MNELTSGQLDIQQRALAHAKKNSFADFINNASPAEKNNLYKTILTKVANSQQLVIERAKKLRGS